jgi:hypothetical protein
MKVGDDVEMIFHSIDPVEVRMALFDNTPNEFVQLFFVISFDGSRAVFCSEYNMIEDLLEATHITVVGFEKVGSVFNSCKGGGRSYFIGASSTCF